MRRKKKRTIAGRARPAVLAALLVPVLAAAGVVLARRRRSHPADLDLRGPAGSAPGPVSQDPVTERVEQQWTCQCGQAYRISGEGLHRIYWLPDASIADPVMDGRCVNCGRPLPGEQPDPVQAS